MYDVECPACASFQSADTALGVLGDRQHFTCRYCGIGFSRIVERPVTDPAVLEHIERQNFPACCGESCQ